MDFAPYQDTSPELHRALSPPPSGAGRRSSSFSPKPALSPTTNAKPHNPWASSTIPTSPSQQAFRNDGGADLESGHGEGNMGSGNSTREGRLNEFETSLPIRLDYEACLAYLLLPPAGGVLLLVLEQKSDYVRFHAWQSSLLFTAMFVLHLLVLWSSFLSWVVFLGDLGLIGYLTLRAYRDADTLDRCEVPFFGRLASRILDDE